MILSHDLIGSGPGVVLIHGITENRMGFDPLVADLMSDHTVLTIDLPGHGESAKAESHDVFTFAEAVAGTIGSVDIGTPLVIGHSLGGMVATVLAGTMPVRGVVNIDQPLALGDFAEQLKALGPALRGDEATFVATIRTMFDSMYGQLNGDESVRVRALSRPDQEVVLGIWGAVLDGEVAELDELTRGLLSTITVPYLAVHGADVGDYDVWLRDAMPQVELEEWPGVGHFPHLVHPRRFLERVRAFEATLG